MQERGEPTAAELEVVHKPAAHRVEAPQGQQPPLREATTAMPEAGARQPIEAGELRATVPTTRRRGRPQSSHIPS